MTEPWFWAQLLGGVAALLGVVAFQCRQDRRMLMLLSGSCVAWSLHFLLLGQATAALLNLVTALRNLVGLRFQGAYLAAAFITVYLLVGSQSWQSAWDILPVTAVVSGSVAVFFLVGIPRRFALLIGSLLWLVFNLHAGSVPGVVVMIADSLSNLVRIRKLHRLAVKS